MCLVLAAALTSARAADLGSVKDDLGVVVKDGIPEIPPLTWRGLTLYGVVDVSALYMSHSAPASGQLYAPLAIIAPQNRGPAFMLGSNSASQSLLGLKAKEPLAYGFSFIGKIEMGFNPTSGQLSDALGSIRAQNGLATAQQGSSADGPRAGQAFSGEVYAGVQHETLGALTVGRQNTLSTDALFAYDPLISYGFSLVGYIGAPGGQGSSEVVRVDSAIRYKNAYGPFRVAAIYANPQSNVKDIWQLDAGVDYAGFSADVVGGHANDEVTAGSLGAAFAGSPFLGAKVYDTDMIGAFGRYKYALSETSYLSLSGGWEHIDYKNPADGGLAPGHTDIGGYQIGPGYSTNGLASGGIVNYGFTGGDKTLDVSFVAIKYQHDPRLSFAVGYYRFDQNSFGFGVASVAPGAALFYSKTNCSTSKYTNCSGNEQVVGLRADYQFNRNFMVYAGGAYSAVANGLAFGYLNKVEFSPTVGLRFTF